MDVSEQNHRYNFLYEKFCEKGFQSEFQMNSGDQWLHSDAAFDTFEVPDQLLSAVRTLVCVCIRMLLVTCQNWTFDTFVVMYQPLGSDVAIIDTPVWRSGSAYCLWLAIAEHSTRLMFRIKPLGSAINTCLDQNEGRSRSRGNNGFNDVGYLLYWKSRIISCPQML